MSEPTRRQHGDLSFDPLLMIAAISNPTPKPTARDMAMFGFSAETKKFIQRAIELNPAMEELILLIADSAYADGECAQEED